MEVSLNYPVKYGLTKEKIQISGASIFKVRGSQMNMNTSRKGS